MPALRKPHRLAFLLPVLTVEGADTVHAHEAALLVWSACIETCQRHPGLAVYDAESTPLVPHEGHFAPQHATIGATPDDPFFGPTRRDELAWLELGLGRAGVVRLHTLARDGTRQSFDAIGKHLGDQIQQVLSSWLSARGLPALPRRFEAVSAEELVATVRVFAPLLIDQARAWARPVSTLPTWIDADAARQIELAAEQVEEVEVTGTSGDGVTVEAGETSDAPVTPPAPAPAPVSAPATPSGAPVSKQVRPIAVRLPAALKVPALRVLELALGAELGDLILALDPEQPQALFARFLETRDVALLRRVISAAPCWARPYAELVRRDRAPGDPDSPTELEAVAGAGIAALCRPAHLDVIETVAELLGKARLIEEGVRLLERALVTHGGDARAHLALLARVAEAGREGALLEQAHASARLHGCPMDPALPWYPDQIQIDLRAADALLRVGRLDEAITLRGNRLEGREATWPRHTQILTAWKQDPRRVAWCYAREAAFRGDPARVVEGFGRIEPENAVDVALFLDALVAMGREDEVELAWAHYGRGRGRTTTTSRLAAARALCAAEQWRPAIEELWRVELTEPGRDEQCAISRIGLILSGAPIDVLETALGERLAIGATTLARRMARTVADFVPGAANSSLVARALGKATSIEFDPATLGGFARDTHGREALDAMFSGLCALTGAAVLQRADKLVNRWLEVVFTDASEDDAPALVQAAAYTAAHALGRYLAATTAPASPMAGALRTVAAEALAVVRKHRAALTDRDAGALLATIDLLLRRVDRWIGGAWLAAVERSCGIDERASGDVAGFAGPQATVAARILGPEESTVLAASIAQLHRERPERWAAAVSVQAKQLALHTGYLGADEWADAVVAQRASGAIDAEDAIDALHVACYLAEGSSARPCVHAARALLEAGRGPAAIAVLAAGLRAADAEWRAQELATLAGAWASAGVDLPMAFDEVATATYEALQRGDAARAEKLGRWAVAIDPSNAEAHRNLGLALAQQRKVAAALEHLVRATPDQATQILAGVAFQSGQLPDAMRVLDYASRWYVRADQWLTYGGIAYAAMDNPRTAHAYALAYQLDPAAFDETQLNAYAGVLDEVGDYATCERIAQALLGAAGDDLMWKTNAWNHLACAYIGQGKFEQAEQLASDAVAHNTLPANAEAFAATLERARSRTVPTPPEAAPPGRPREPAFALLEAGDWTAAAALSTDSSWRARRVALEASRFRYASENDVEVTARARALASAVLGDTLGMTEREAMLARALAMRIREQALFARDPVPRMGDRMTRDAFYREFRARGGVVLGEAAPPPPKFEDRVIVPGTKVERISDYVALLRDLAALQPSEALAQFDLDEAGYLELGKAWGAAIAADPTIGQAIAAGLAKR